MHHQDAFSVRVADISFSAFVGTRISAKPLSLRQGRGALVLGLRSALHRDGGSVLRDAPGGEHSWMPSRRQQGRKIGILQNPGA